MATGTPVEGGLTVAQAKQLIQAFASDSRTRCIEITEFNPSLPQPKEMMVAIEEILSVSGLLE
jgi:arginase family enzyme